MGLIIRDTRLLEGSMNGEHPNDCGCRYCEESRWHDDMNREFMVFHWTGMQDWDVSWCY